MQIQGNYFSANQSQRNKAILLVNTDNRITVKLASHSLVQDAQMDDIEISPRLGNTPRTFSFLDGAMFESSENDEIDHWLRANKVHNPLGWIYTLESRLSYVLMTLVFVIVFSWGFIQYGVPSITDSVAKMLPTEVNQYLGKGSLALLDKSYFSESKLSSKRQTELLSKFDRYASQYKKLNLNVVFRQGGKIGANAFALPDGHIVFTDEMVELAKNDLELVAIFGHEIGHLERRHLLRRVIQNSLLASLVVLITGDISYASSVVIALPVLLLELSYSRQFEEEADNFAFNFLQKNRIATSHFAHIMLRLSKLDDDKKEDNINAESSEGKVSEYLSSHPVTDKRIKPFLNNSAYRIEQ